VRCTNSLKTLKSENRDSQTVECKELEERQKAVCTRFGTEYCPPEPKSIFGCALSTLASAGPLNGLRHPVEKGTSGWFIWRGVTLSSEDSFFQPLHLEHALEECPEALDFLALPPGWRFLVDGEYVDVWFDASLLGV
jgi:hypothetical protein